MPFLTLTVRWHRAMLSLTLAEVTKKNHSPASRNPEGSISSSWAVRDFLLCCFQLLQCKLSFRCIVDIIPEAKDNVQTIAPPTCLSGTVPKTPPPGACLKPQSTQPSRDAVFPITLTKFSLKLRHWERELERGEKRQRGRKREQL